MRPHETDVELLGLAFGVIVEIDARDVAGPADPNQGFSFRTKLRLTSQPQNCPQALKDVLTHS